MIEIEEMKLGFPKLKLAMDGNRPHDIEGLITYLSFIDGILRYPTKRGIDEAKAVIGAITRALYNCYKTSL